MSLKWNSGTSESGILRKSEFREKKEELFVFGYSCKLFRDDDKALHIDQGKHLIPWMGDETLKIDRYDARGALHELGRHEAPPGGYDWRVELTKTEQDVEQLCDEERYRALHTDEDEEEMYKEEELKRLHAAGYGQVGFNYDAPAEPESVSQPVEADEPFIPTPAFKALLPPDMLLPETDKQNVIIEKTAKFIATQGAQMEILIKAKQGENPQFQFLNRESELNPYYMALIGLVKAGKWPEKKVEVVEEKPAENEDYLHPSLAYSTIIESAPCIPSIQYKPSADCDYRLLVSRLRGPGALPPGEEPPPGTAPLPPRHHPHQHPHIQRAPVLYTHQQNNSQPAQATAQSIQAQYQQYAAYYQQYVAHDAQPIPPQKNESKSPPKSTGLSLMKNYNTDSDSEGSDAEETSSTDSKNNLIVKPPEEVQVVIEKMAAYVARNGAEFADIVRAKGDPRFSFLDPNDVHHAYYCSRLGSLRNDGGKKPKAPVSFSIKKQKEPDPILPKPALPYESSSEDENDKSDKQTDKETEAEDIKPNTPVVSTQSNAHIAQPVVVYKVEAHIENVPVVTKIEPLTPTQVSVPAVAIAKVIPETKLTEVKEIIQEKIPTKVEEVKKEVKKSATPEVEKKKKSSPRSSDRRESPRGDRKEKYRKKEKSEHRDKSRSKSDHKRSIGKERRKESRKEAKEQKKSKEELENEIISLEDNSDDMIDLTGDHSDTKADVESELERQKQLERRRRAAEFLRKVGVDPAAAAAAALPTSSLASAMVDTLESLRKKKAEAEEKRRKREKKRHRDRYGYDDGDRSHRKNKRRKYKSSDDEDSDYDGSKKKKRRKDKKNPKNKKKKRHEVEDVEAEEVDHPLPPNIDLSNTLKELRTASPTKDLVLQVTEESTVRRESSSDEDGGRRKKKKDREYSEGEWSSDSEDDSVSLPSKNGD